MADAATKFKDVPAFLAALDDDKRAQVEAVRAIVLAANPGLTENIKWNAPSYVLDGEDRVTFNAQNKEGLVKLVLHMGATRPEDKKAPPIMADDAGLAAWASDIRAIITFADADDVAAKSERLRDFVTRWLEIPADAA